MQDFNVLDFEKDYFFITFINEKILLEKINGENNDTSNQNEIDYESPLLKLVFCEKCIEVEMNEIHNKEYIINMSKLVNKKYFTEEVSFDSCEYIRNIYESYKMKWENVYAQYIKDFNRQTIYIDRLIVDNRYVFENFANRFKQYGFQGDSTLNYSKLFIMLTAQSSFYFMYLYSKTFESKIRKMYNNPDLYIVNGPNKTIHFDKNNENDITFRAILTLLVKDANNDKKVLNIIYLELNIIFSLISCCYTNLFSFLTYNNKKNMKTNYGVLYSIII
jgi:hypothetical protein